MSPELFLALVPITASSLLYERHINHVFIHTRKSIILLVPPKSSKLVKLKTSKIH